MTDEPSDEPENLDRQQLFQAITDLITGSEIGDADAGYLLITFDDDGYCVGGSGDPDDEFIADVCGEVSQIWDPDENEHGPDESAN